MILDLRRHGPAVVDEAVDDALLALLREAPTLDPGAIQEARQKAAQALARRAARPTATPRRTRA